MTPTLSLFTTRLGIAYWLGDTERSWCEMKVMMWDEGHDVRWRPWCVKGFPDLTFCARKGIGLLNRFIGIFSRTKVYKFWGGCVLSEDLTLDIAVLIGGPHFHWHLTSPFYWRPHFHPELNYNTIYLVRGGNGAANTMSPKHGVGF